MTDKKVLVPLLTVSSVVLKEGYVECEIDLDWVTLYKLCPELGDKSRALIRMGIPPAQHVVCRAYIYDAEMLNSDDFVTQVDRDELRRILSYLDPDGSYKDLS